MSKQQASPNRAVIFAGLFLALAAGAMGAAIYLYDGVSILASLPDQVASGELWSSVMSLVSEPESSAPSTPTPAPSASTELSLPAGMPTDFALRLWQEQVDSQEMISRLVNGDVTRMVITDVDTVGDTSTLKVRVSQREGGTVDGRIVMRKFGGAWFVSTASAEERVASGATSPLPSLDDVDVALLNTVIAEQIKSKKATAEYADGKVASIEIGAAEMGPNTVRIPVIMNEDHETATADLVAIKQEHNGKDLWFIARFGKTGSEPLTN